jgi:hypothetical protein
MIASSGVAARSGMCVGSEVAGFGHNRVVTFLASMGMLATTVNASGLSIQ